VRPRDRTTNPVLVIISDASRSEQTKAETETKRLPGPEASPVHTPNLLTTLGILGLLTAIIVAGVALIRALRVDLQGSARARPIELLRDLEAAFKKGQMDTAEFERVKRSLEQQAPGSVRSPTALAAPTRRPIEPTAPSPSGPIDQERPSAGDPPIKPPTPADGITESAPDP
jgi:hypothetical protein